MNDTSAVAAKPMPLARREFLTLSSGPNPEDTDFWIRVGPALACIAGNQPMEEKTRVLVG